MPITNRLLNFLHKLLLSVSIFVSLLANSQSSEHRINLREKDFNAEGYYFSNKGYKIGQYIIEWLSIFTEKADLNIVHLRITKDTKWIDISSDNFRVNKNSSFFHFKNKKIGEISIEGKFTGNKGPINDKVETRKTIVFKGTIKINGISSPLEMTWWEGE